MDRLTDQNYWEDYYSKAITQKNQIKDLVGIYDNYWDILINKNDNKEKKTIIELGGYPGRYLAYLSDKYDLIPTCLDFNSDRVKVEETMKAFNIEKYDIIQADILNYSPNMQYDIVISNGFIEHFLNYEEVLNNHAKYLKDGGTMLVMIPNKRWLRKWYGFLVDYKNLKAHNLKCMKKSTFLNFASKNNLNLLSIEYFGGFAFSVHQKLNFFQKIIYKSVRFCFKLFNPWLKNHPSKFYSASLIAVFKK